MNLIDNVSPPSNFPKKSLRLIKEGLTNGRALLRADARVVFICGGSKKNSGTSARADYMEYARVHLPNFSFFEAEDVFTALTHDRKKDLLSLEKKFAKYSDCIIIITESAGAIAELGAFAMDDIVAKKVLAINDERYRTEESFIALGPIRKLDKISKFKPTIHTSFERILLVASDMEERLNRIPNSYRKNVELHSAKALATCEEKHRLLFLADMIALLCPLSYREFIGCMQYFYGTLEFDIQIEISMLEAIGLITRPGEFLIRTAGDYKHFYDYERIDLTRIRSQVIRHFHKQTLSRTAILTLRSGG